MTNEDIKAKIKKQLDLIESYHGKIENALCMVRYLQSVCPHTSKDSWTNDDGDGSYKVEKCLICGLQKDGGL